ncbi:MAG TPA: HAMP domain-containing protein [Planctomycetes bacterium]|nr:HAMP domain-containing protein [Planctomycetota bacterium]
MAVKRGATKRGGARREMGLGARIALFVGGTVSLLFVLILMILLSKVRGSLESEVREKGILASEALADGGKAAWIGASGKAAAGSAKRLSALVQASGGTILNAYIELPSGKVLSSVYKVEGLDLLGSASQMGRTEVRLGVYRSGNFRARVHRFRTPILGPRGETVAKACILLSEETIANGVASVRNAFLGLGLLLVLAVLGVSFFLGNQVTKPIRELAQAVGRINRGNLRYRAPDKMGGDEVQRLALALEGMVDELRAGADVGRQLAEKEREEEVLAELRDALLPKELPQVPGFEIEACLESGKGGAVDFYDSIPLEGGRVALVVVSTSGKGALGVLIAGMAQAYLRAFLEEGVPAGETLKKTNRKLAGVMRKGMYATAQVAVLDPVESRAMVYIAGHRAPFFACRAGEISVVHGEGLALGLDEGKVFDQRLEEVPVDMPPGTRIVLLTQGAYAFAGEEGLKFGRESFQELVRRHAPKNSAVFLSLVFGSLDEFLGEAQRASDATVVTAKRMV